jgi:hypothetical protein
MTAVVLAVLAGWLVLSALATAAFALVARGGSQEDAMRASVDARTARWADPSPGQDEQVAGAHTAVGRLPLR